MGSNSSIGRFFTEKLFYRSVVGLLVGLPVIELFTEIAYRFDNNSFLEYSLKSRNVLSLTLFFYRTAFVF